MTMPSAVAPRLARWRLAAVSAPCIPIAAVGPPIGLFLPAFFAQDVGLGLTAVGIAFMGMRLLNTALIPIVGAAMDATYGAFGRFRPWLAIGSLFLGASVYALFMAEPGADMIYLCFWLGILYLSNSICVASQASWTSSLSTDYAERSRIYGWWQAFNVVGTIIVLTLPIFFFTDRDNYGESVRAMGWVILLLFVPALLCALAFGREPPAPRRHATKPQITPRWALLKRPTVRRILATCMLIEAIGNVRGPITLFFFISVKALTARDISLLLLAQLFGALAGAGFWSAFATRRGKHETLIISSIFFAISQLTLFIVPAGLFWPAGLVMIASGFCTSAGPALVRAMMADASDEALLDTGADRAGLLQSLISMANNIGAALAVGFALIMLGLLGYRGGAMEMLTTTAAWGLPIVYILVPTLLGIAIAIVMKGYSLTAARHAEVRAGLSQQEEAKSAITPGLGIPQLPNNGETIG